MLAAAFPGRFHRLKNALLDAVFPPKCMICGIFYPAENTYPAKISRSDRNSENDDPPQAFSRQMAPFLCLRCRDDFTCLDTPVCSLCGKPFEDHGDGDMVCDACRGQLKNVGRVRAFGIYEGSLKTALHHLKYRSKTQLAGPLGNLLFSSFRRHWRRSEIDFVVPVPLHRKKFRKRGFNQAFLLIRRWPELALKKNISLPREMIQKSVLRRIRETGAQVGMNRVTRRTNLRQAFTVGSGVDVSGKRILLVDDVYTTGATADECAAVLLYAGALRVDVLTLAQTVRNR